LAAVERIRYIGVSTAGSRIHQVFPAWAHEFGRPLVLDGIDVPLGAPSERYRAVVQSLRDDPEVLGAVVTSHKLSIFAAAHDLLAHTDEFASLLHEFNALSTQDGALSGYARDPLAVAHVLPSVLGADWMPGRSDVVCFGAGGAGSALALALLYRKGDHAFAAREDVPRRLTFVDTDAARLAALRSLLAALPAVRSSVIYAQHDDARENDALITGLPPGSLVINATGLGKDHPGSPLTRHAMFPEASTAWDFNYRGTLEFLATAQTQATTRTVSVHDGWDYFLHGWTQALSPVLDIEITPERFATLARAATPMRP
jgi:shikimate 5-dehydrogenase